MAPKNDGLSTANLQEHTRWNLVRIASQLGMMIEDFQTVVPRKTDDGTSELLRLWSALDCALARARVLDHFRAEVATRATQT